MTEFISNADKLFSQMRGQLIHATVRAVAMTEKALDRNLSGPIIDKRSTGMQGGGRTMSLRQFHSGHREADQVINYPGLITEPVHVDDHGVIKGGAGFASGDPLAWVLEFGSTTTPAKRPVTKTLMQLLPQIMELYGAKM